MRSSGEMHGMFSGAIVASAKFVRVKRATESGKIAHISYWGAKNSLPLCQVQRHSLFLDDVFVTAIGHPPQRLQVISQEWDIIGIRQNYLH